MNSGDVPELTEGFMLHHTIWYEKPAQEDTKEDTRSAQCLFARAE